MSHASINEVVMDNTGRGPIQVPGFGGIPVEYELTCKDRFAHGADDWKQVPAVTAREFAMVAVMNTLTDKPEWQVNIFDDEVVALWREEAFATTPLMSEKAWTWCLAELRDKAVYFKENQYIRVLDTGSCICKSDTLIPESLGSEFRSGIVPLLEQQDKDWQFESEEQVLNLVQPSLFPLVYGRSLALEAGGQVDLDNVFGFYEKAEVAPKHFDRRVDFDSIAGRKSKVESYHWSSNFQWLPCEVEFLEKFGTDVHITSYINNLHPTHKSLYRSIEKLISLAIKPWNDCLIQGEQGWQDVWNRRQRGPVPLRIITYGVEWENELPEWALAFNLPPLSRIERYQAAKEIVKDIPDSVIGEDKEKKLKAQRLVDGMGDMKVRENMKKPTPDLWRLAKEYLELPDNGSTVPGHVPKDWAESEKIAWSYILRKHERLMYFKHPEPGTAFSYEDWKAGKNNKAVVDLVSPFSDSSPGSASGLVSPDHKSHTITLQDTFRKQGLQIVVKIYGVELTPDKLRYRGGSWQLEGQKNEHIVATAMYSYDVKNVTETRISFRQETPIHGRLHKYAADRYTKDEYHFLTPPAHRYGKYQYENEALAEILGFEMRDLRKKTPHTANGGMLPFQNIGSVWMTQGRLITFPHTMEHCIEPFELVDPSLPGHHRFVVLYLVDPHYRVCSTRNVPPQQFHWWAEAVSRDFYKLGVPREISAEITGRTGDWLMCMDEATIHRLEMKKEHLRMDSARYRGMSRYKIW